MTQVPARAALEEMLFTEAAEPLDAPPSDEAACSSDSEASAAKEAAFQKAALLHAAALIDQSLQETMERLDLGMPAPSPERLAQMTEARKQLTG